MPPAASRLPPTADHRGAGAPWPRRTPPAGPGRPGGRGAEAAAEGHPLEREHDRQSGRRQQDRPPGQQARRHDHGAGEQIQAASRRARLELLRAQPIEAAATTGSGCGRPLWASRSTSAWSRRRGRRSGRTARPARPAPGRRPGHPAPAHGDRLVVGEEPRRLVEVPPRVLGDDVAELLELGSGALVVATSTSQKAARLRSSGVFGPSR